MTTVYCLIDCRPGRDREAYTRIWGTKEVVELHLVFGGCDLVAKIEATNPDEVIAKKIWPVSGVIQTRYLTVTAPANVPSGNSGFASAAA